VVIHPKGVGGEVVMGKFAIGVVSQEANTRQGGWQKVV